MHPANALVLSLVCLGTLSVGCKQQAKEDLGPDPLPTAAATAPAPQAAAEPAATIAPPVQPPTVPAASSAPAATAKPQDKGADAQAIKACCAALRQEQSQVPDNDKGMYRSAANSCDAILKLVAAGTTSRASALASIRAALKGGKLPASCR